MSFYKEVPGRKTTLESTLKFDTAPTSGSTNPVTSDGVSTAITEAVDVASEDLQEQIDDIAEKAGSGYTPKGEASVATLNGLTGQENGWLYTMTDAGTLTDGSLAVTAGDTVAWDATNSVWYKAMDYAPRQYGTNEVRNLSTAITAFRTGDVIPVDGPSGTAKMSKDSLLQESVKNTAKEFTSSTKNLVGDIVSHNGVVYRCIKPNTGVWRPERYVAFDLGEEVFGRINRIENNLNEYQPFKRVINNLRYRQASYNGSTGSITFDTTRLQTSPTNFMAKGTKIHFPSSVECAVFCFSDGDYDWDSIDYTKITYRSGWVASGEIVIPSDAYVLIIFRYPDSATITVDDAFLSSVEYFLDVKFGEENLDDDFVEGTKVYSENLFVINNIGTYLDGDGNTVLNTMYDSCLLPLENGSTYKITQAQSQHNIRLFTEAGGVYTQVDVWKSSSMEIDVPSSGNYVLQVIKNYSNEGFPTIRKKGTTLSLVNLQQIKDDGKPCIKILSIGNSYSRDNFSYLPKLLEVYGFDVKFGILYKGGCTLQEHYDIWNGNSTYLAFDEYSTQSGMWKTTANYNCNTALASQEWDIIVLQQASSGSRDYSTYQPYLNDLINILISRSTKPFKLAWLLTMAYPTGYSELAGDTSDEMFGKIVNAVESVIADTCIDCVIPCGTAIQNARHTSLSSIGVFGDLSYEGLHLQSGLPYLCASYAALIKIFELSGKSCSGILSEKTRPTDDWIARYNIINPHGSSVGVTDANCYLAQKCAIAASKKPLEISTVV